MSLLDNELNFMPVTIVRAPAVLTNSYVLGEKIIDNVQENNQLIAHIVFTLGSLTSATIKIETSLDGEVWAQETFDHVDLTTGKNTLTLGTNDLLASGVYEYARPIKTRYIRFSAVGTGTVTGSSLAIYAITHKV